MRAPRNPNAYEPTQMKFGPSKKDLRAQQEAMAAANKVTPLPDPTDIAVRKRQADELKALLKRRGRSSTLLSGRAGDMSATPMKRATIGRM